MDLKLPNSEGSEEFKVPPFAALRRGLLWAGMRFCHHDTDTESLGGGGAAGGEAAHSLVIGTCWGGDTGQRKELEGLSHLSRTDPCDRATSDTRATDRSAS